MYLFFEIIFIALVCAAAILLSLRLNKDGQAFKLNGASFSNKKTRSDIDILIICVLWTLAIKALHLIVAYVLTKQNPFLQSTWEKVTDVPHYIDIAKDGYINIGFNAKWIVFFPLYPYLLGFVALFTKEYFITGSFLSMAFFTVGAFFFYKFSREEYGEKNVLKSVKYLYLFPSSFFAMLPMSEGLFVMLAAGFLYALKKERFLYAAVCGFAAALTRSAGVLFIIPYLIKVFKTFFLEDKKRDLSEIAVNVILAVIIPLGTLYYLYLNYALFGDPLMFTIYQRSYWSQGLGFFGKTIATLIDYAVNAERAYRLALWLPQVAAAFFCGFTIVLVAKNRKSEYSAYALTQTVFSLSAKWLISAPRYLLPILPIYNELAEASDSKAFNVIVTILAAAANLYLVSAFLLTGLVY